MKKFTYPTLEISGSREDVKMYLDREYKIYPKVNMNDYQLLSFGHSMIELKSEIFHYHSSVIYNHGWWPFDDDVERPEETILTDLDLI